jgi:hypothetical protein
VTISSARMTTGFRAEQTRALDLVTAAAPITWDTTWSFTDGTGANQASGFFSDTRTLSASATENLDVATGGGLLDAFGIEVAADRIKALAIVAASGNTNDVQVTRPAANGVPFMLAAGDGFALTPGAGCLFTWPNANGVNVTAATGDLITITNSAGGTSVEYSIAILYTV